MKNKKRLNLKWNVIILTIITVLIVVLTIKDDFFDIVNVLSKVNIFWIVIAIFLVLICWLLKASTITLFSKNFNKKYSFKSAMIMTLSTQFFNAITPFSSGGQPFQVYALSKNKIKTNQAISVVAVSFICYQIALVLIGIISILINNVFHMFDKITLLQKLVTIGFSINVFVIALTLVLVFSKKINKKVAKILINLLNKINIVKNKDEAIEKVNDKLLEFYNSGKVLLNNKKDFVIGIFYNFISIICLYMIPIIIIFSIGNYKSLNIISSIVCSSYTMMIGSFVPLPGGIGGIEYGFINFFGQYLNGPILKVLMLLWRFFTYYFGMFLGILTLNFMKRRK